MNLMKPKHIIEELSAPPTPPGPIEELLVRIGKYPATIGYTAVMTTLLVILSVIHALW